MNKVHVVSIYKIDKEPKLHLISDKVIVASSTCSSVSRKFNFYLEEPIHYPPLRAISFYRTLQGTSPVY